MTLPDGSSVRRVRLGKGEFWALTAALAYALNSVFTGVAVRGHDLNYFLGVSLRATPIFLFSLVMGRHARRRNPNLVSPLSDWRLLAPLIGYGVLTFVVANPLLFAALEKGGILVASPVTGTQVFWGALLAALFLHEPFTRGMAAGMAISVLGIFVLSLGRSGDVTLSPTWWLAVPYATATAFCWSLSGVLVTYTMRRGVDRFPALAIATLTGIVLNNAYLLATGNMGLYVTTPRGLLLNVLIAGLFNTVALVSVTTAFSLTTVASASTLNSLQVGLAPLIAWIFVGERMTWLMGLGILLIMGGVMVMQRARGTKQNER
jgi:drug/metabolite transporter (DMT)-like permease